MGLDDRDYMKRRRNPHRFNNTRIVKSNNTIWERIKHHLNNSFLRKVPDVIGYIVIIYLIYVFSTGGFTLTDSAANYIGELQDTIHTVKYTELDHAPNQKERSIKIFGDINKFRAENHKFKILWSEDAYNLAKFRADDMVKRGYFSHYTPDGKDVSDYIGYYNFYADSSWGENICKNCDEPTTQWINSPGHREILLAGWGKGAAACEGDICVFIGVSE